MADGPKTLDEELLECPPEVVDETERLKRIHDEFERGFDLMKDVRMAVSIFGSARVPAGEPQYEAARETARLLASNGFQVITGGGPGIMEAANRGAREGGGLSIGINIELPF